MACYIPRRFTCPWAVTHPSTNRVRCRLPSLIKLTGWPLHYAAIRRLVEDRDHGRHRGSYDTICGEVLLQKQYVFLVSTTARNNCAAFITRDLIYYLISAITQNRLHSTGGFYWLLHIVGRKKRQESSSYHKDDRAMRPIYVTYMNN